MHQTGSLVWWFENGNDTLPRMTNASTKLWIENWQSHVGYIVGPFPLLLCCMHHLQSNNWTTLSGKLTWVSGRFLYSSVTHNLKHPRVEVIYFLQIFCLLGFFCLFNQIQTWKKMAFAFFNYNYFFYFFLVKLDWKSLFWWLMTDTITSSCWDCYMFFLAQKETFTFRQS